ncbi:hypothetical protein OPU71_18435 [Niveibacterium sp. 24ML]|uniref:hypothetical protein n=1 Tax=Niveibacterium sp. 24ML TaxID=2985512 RepID=UPI0022715012|nr:hypothetical protein [Niveibacterium sp. 24ML]MCX9158104.1 hypothetical protein [Niveibacterium sp. 24ML]
MPTSSPEAGSIDVLMTVLGQRYVQYYPVLAELTGSAKAALMLGHMLYWSRKYLAGRSEREGWFWHTRRDWHAATGLSRDEQERARRCLREAGLISERLMGVPARLHYRIELEVLGSKIARHLRKQFAGWRWDDAFVRGLLGRNIAFLRGLADVSGSIHAALYLSELCAAHRRTQNDRKKNRGGWMDLPIGEAASRLSLSEKSLRRARAFLRERRLIRERSSGGVQPRTLTFIELPTIAERVIQNRQRVLVPVERMPVAPGKAAESAQKAQQALDLEGMAESAIPDLPKPANWNGGNVHSRGAQTRQLEWRKAPFQTFPNPPTGSAQTRQLELPIPANKLGENVSSIKEVLSTQKLKPLLTPTELAGDATAAHAASAQCGGGWEEDSLANTASCNAAPVPLQLDRPLPAGVSEEEAAQALDLIQRLPAAQQQPVLDEWIGQLRIPGKIANRLGYLFALVRSARQNEFVALIGLQVAKERAHRQHVKEAVARSRTTVAAEVVATVGHERRGAPSASVADARQAIQDIRRKLR